MKLKFEDENITDCQINECQGKDGIRSIAAFLQLDFNQLLGGAEIMLTEKELEQMLNAIRNEENNSLFGPIKLSIDPKNETN